MKKGSKQNDRVGGIKPHKQLTLRELHDEFIVDCKIRGLAHQTIISYTNQYRYFVKYLSEDTKVCNITLETVKGYIIHIKDRGIERPSTINSYLQDLSPMLKYAIRKRYILEDFKMPFVLGQESTKEVYTKEELTALLGKPRKTDFLTMRSYTIIWVLSSTGVRARELRCMQIKHVDLFNRVITLAETKNKKVRQVPISRSLYGVLMEYLDIRGGQSEDYLFPTIYNEIMAMTSLKDSIKRYCNERGVTKTSLHLFRHTFITNAVNRGVSPLVLQRITGHSTMTQLNRYYNSRIEDIVDVIDDIAPTNQGKKRIL